MLNSIVGWLLGKAGSWLLNIAVNFLEGKWPGLKPIIDQILAWLGQGVTPAQITEHLVKADFKASNLDRL